MLLCGMMESNAGNAISRGGSLPPPTLTRPSQIEHTLFSVSLCQVLLHLVEEAGLPVGGPAYGPRLIADEYRGLTVWQVEGGVSLPRCFCPVLYTL